MCDVGLVRRKVNTDASSILEENTDIYEEFKGELAKEMILLE